MAVRFMKLEDMKFYLYKSKAKIESFYQQTREPQGKLKWKFDLKVFSVERKADDERNLDEKLKAVIAALEEQKLVGDGRKKAVHQRYFPDALGYIQRQRFSI